MRGEQCEWRTRICFSTEDHMAPALFKIEQNIARSIFRALSKNTTVQMLKINGHAGPQSNPNSEKHFILIIIHFLFIF